MKRLIACTILLTMLALPMMALRPSGWMYGTQSGSQFLYDSQSGKWYFVQASPAVCAANMNTGLWYKFENTLLREGWSYWQWPYVYGQLGGDWHFLAEGTAPWMCDLSSGLWQKMGEQSANLAAGTWSAASGNTYSLTVTVNAQSNVSGAYLKVYYNDGWMGSDSYTFTSSDISQSGATFVAKKEDGVFNSAGNSLYYYEIAGTFQANGTITGTYKGSYYQKPSGRAAHTNTKQGGFTATR